MDARGDGACDRSRLTLKETLRLLTAEGGAYERAADGDPELKEIIGLAREYAAYEVTAIAGDYAGEVASFKKLCGKLDGYLEKQEELQYTEASDSPEAQTRYLTATGLSHLVAPQRFGNLDPEREALLPGAVIVDGVTPTFVTDKDDRQIRYPNDQPLFPHDPSPNDISQGALGNCYMLACLSTVASLAPEKIKDSMRDNGDGTVTVRFLP